MAIHVSITHEKVLESNIIETLQSTWKQNGALVTFSGIVRPDRIQNRKVVAIEYESYKSMAEKEIEKILHEAIERFYIDNACMIHRIGVIPVGETALFVAVGSSHRQEAFQAIQYLVREMKTRVPIWKKELFDDGSHRWKEEEYA